MQASVQAVETRTVPTAGAASAPTDPPAPRRTVSPRVIEIVGLVLGIAFITAVAMGRELSNDAFWSLAAGQWMIAHHAVMGLDPFSYTESHRRWVTDEWGSEVALASLYRVFGAAASNVYAVLLGGLSLVATAAYARSLGAKGGRVAAIVLLLAVGLAGVVAADRGLDFSLVWLPLELLVLTKARADPRWLLCLPPLCAAWVNTHGSILIGLLVLGVELGWSLAPARFVDRIGGVRRSTCSGALALASLGSLIASCLTPYGPGLLAYDVDVARNAQIARYIDEWNSPDFHSFMVLLVYCVPLLVLIACVRARRIPVLEGSLAAALFVEALRTQRLVVYLMVVAAGLAATLAGPAVGDRGPPVGGRRPRRVRRLRPGRPLRAGRDGVTDAARAGVRLPRAASRAHLHGVHLGRLLHRAPTGHLRRRPHGPLRGRRADRVLRGDRSDDEPGPGAVGGPRLLRGVGAGHAPRGVPRARPPLARGGPVGGGAGVRPVVGPPRQPQTASMPRGSPSSSDHVSMEP